MDVAVDFFNREGTLMNAKLREGFQDLSRDWRGWKRIRRTRMHGPTSLLQRRLLAHSVGGGRQGGFLFHAMTGDREYLHIDFRGAVLCGQIDGGGHLGLGFW